MPDLDCEKSAAHRKSQQGKWLEILTPNQMLSRLPTSFYQLTIQKNLKMN